MHHLQFPGSVFMRATKPFEISRKAESWVLPAVLFISIVFPYLTQQQILLTCLEWVSRHSSLVFIETAPSFSHSYCIDLHNISFNNYNDICNWHKEFGNKCSRLSLMKTEMCEILKKSLNCACPPASTYFTEDSNRVGYSMNQLSVMVS